MKPTENPHLQELRVRVGKLPTEPGVYRWMNEKGDVLYVGKAKDIRSRTRSYVQEKPDKAIGPWKLSLISQIADIDVTVTQSELEALILETNLIKELKPKYNVLMKDDKNYVYVKICLDDPYPRIEIVRQMEDDNAKYFGPHLNASSIRSTLGILRKMFPYRTCKMDIRLAGSANTQVSNLESRVSQAELPKEAVITLDVVCKNRDRPTPCLDFHMKQCVAPCIGTVTPEEYRVQCIDGVLQFLKGNQKEVMETAKKRMQEAALNKRFEAAAQWRDNLLTLQNLQEKQIVSDTSGEDADIVGVAVEHGQAQVVVLRERGGKVLEELQFPLKGEADTASQVLSQFLPQYIFDAAELPDFVIIPEDIPEKDLIEKWMCDKRGKKVVLRVPERGKKSQLLDMAEKNAKHKLQQREAKWEAAARNTEDALQELQDILHLPTKPLRIEGYDISHLGGTETVGSMVVIRDGKASNDHYRSFTLRTVKQGEIDDYKALREVLRRRLRHLTGGFKEECKQWSELGVDIGKAKKAEQPTIEAIIERHPGVLSQKEIDYKTTVVARKDGNIIGMCRMRMHEGKLLELSSVWVEEEHQGGKLGHTLIRCLLHPLKKGKVYVRVLPELEEYYAQVGFRYVQEAPPLFQQLRAQNPEGPDRLVMVYDILEHKSDSSLESKPDLLVIDGGKGQLSAALEMLHLYNMDIPVIGLAKREEEVFIPGKSVPVLFPKDSQAKFLLMRLRNEAHRFANRHREKRLKKKAVLSSLDEIPGIGPDTKKKLLQAFGTIAFIRQATDEELLSIVTEGQLKLLREQL